MLAKWNPFNGGIARSSKAMPSFDDFFKETDEWLNSSVFRDFAWPATWTSSAQLFSPAADVEETDEALMLKVDLPGHDPKAIQVKVEGDTLTIQSERRHESKKEKRGLLRAERSYGVFTRSFSLPSTVDAAKCEARFEHGVLTVTMPKREDAKPRTIDIKVQS